MSKVAVNISRESYDDLMRYRERKLPELGVSRLTISQTLELAIRDAMCYVNVPSRTFRVRTSVDLPQGITRSLVTEASHE